MDNRSVGEILDTNDTSIRVNSHEELVGLLKECKSIGYRFFYATPIPAIIGKAPMFSFPTHISKMEPDRLMFHKYNRVVWFGDILIDDLRFIC